MVMMMKNLLFALLSICVLTESIAEPIQTEITLESDNDISISQAGGTGDRVLWIPSEFGLNRERHDWMIEKLANLGHEVWLAELHTSYFLSPGRTSYTEVPVEDIADLIIKSLPEDERKLFIVTASRGAALTLIALNELKRNKVDHDKIAGLVLIHPNFQANTPVPGADIEYLSVVDTTQMPIYMIQPDKSNRYWYMEGLIERLSDAGSLVYAQVITDVSDGYHARPDSTEAERRKSKELPTHIARAIRILDKTHVPPGQNISDSDFEWEMTGLSGKLERYPNPSAAPELKLIDTDDTVHDLASYKGRVVVLNFWTTWCPPCVEEIPSLGRLQDAFSKDELVVLSVDIGEKQEDIDRFLSRIPADFPVLIDSEGDTVKQWKIIAFPTTFVIDREGIIRLAYYGGLEWDTPEVIQQLQSLLNKT